MAASRARCKRCCSTSTRPGLIFVISRAGLTVLYRRTGPIAIPGEIAMTCRGLIGDEFSLNIASLTPPPQTSGSQGLTAFSPLLQHLPLQHALQWSDHVSRQA